MPTVGVRVPLEKGAQALALGRRALVAAENDRIVVVELETGEARTLRAPFAVTELALSPSGRFLAAAPERRRREQAVVFDLQGGDEQVLGPSGEGPLTALTFTKDHFNEFLLIARDERELHLMDPSGRTTRGALSSGWCVIDQVTQTSVFHVAVTGHAQGESTTTLVTFRQQEGTDFGRLSDEAARLNVGPGPLGAYVAFRDDKGNAESPLAGFTGLYLREPDSGEVLERIPWSGPIRRNDLLFATQHWIALAMGPQAQLVPRDGGGEPIVLEGVASAVDVHGEKLVVLAGDGEATVLDPY
jgi:hypothetical protein